MLMKSLHPCAHVKYSKVRPHPDTFPPVKQDKRLFISIRNPYHIVLVCDDLFRLGPHLLATFCKELRQIRVKIGRRYLHSFPSFYIFFFIHYKWINQFFPCRVKHCENIC